MIAKFKDIKTLDEFAKLDLKWLVDGFIKEQTIHSALWSKWWW